MAELVGLTRAIDLALTPRSNSDCDMSALVAANVDAVATGWSSLLPTSKKKLQRSDGSFDEVLFKANALLLAYVLLIFMSLCTCY